MPKVAQAWVSAEACRATPANRRAAWLQETAGVAKKRATQLAAELGKAKTDEAVLGVLDAERVKGSERKARGEYVLQPGAERRDTGAHYTPKALTVLASQTARHGAYRAALDWYQALSVALDQDDTERLANVLSRGALRPGEEPKRFEIAVLLTLLSGIEQRLAQLGDYEVRRDLIVGDREQVATFRRPGGAEVAVYYDQAVLPLDDELGPRDRGTQHYLQSHGRCRPDITVRAQAANGTPKFTVFEIKLSDSVSYAASGYAEAIVYRHEYDPYLTGWPKAVLVTSQPTQGEPRREDDVVAVAWNQLADSEIIAGTLAPILDSAVLRS